MLATGREAAREPGTIGKEKKVERKRTTEEQTMGREVITKGINKSLDRLRDLERRQKRVEKGWAVRGVVGYGESEGSFAIVRVTETKDNKIHSSKRLRAVVNLKTNQTLVDEFRTNKKR